MTKVWFIVSSLQICVNIWMCLDVKMSFAFISREWQCCNVQMMPILCVFDRVHSQWNSTTEKIPHQIYPTHRRISQSSPNPKQNQWHPKKRRILISLVQVCLALNRIGSKDVMRFYVNSYIVLFLLVKIALNWFGSSVYVKIVSNQSDHIYTLTPFS